MSEKPFGISVLIEPWRLGMIAAIAALRWRRPRRTRIVVARLSDHWLREYERHASKHGDEL
jgi:uncharacterized protein YjiS (DUF1127 family)